MKSLAKNTVLLIVDVQKGFADPYWGVRNNPEAETKILELLTSWREIGWPVVHIRHMSTETQSPLRPGQIGNEFKDIVTPLATEHIEEKNVNSSFIGTGLESYLRANGYTAIVIVGLSTDHCVSTTTRMSGNLGFDTYVVSDATATFNRTGYDGKEYSAEQIHTTALASLHSEFATVASSADILQSLAAFKSA